MEIYRISRAYVGLQAPNMLGNHFQAIRVHFSLAYVELAKGQNILCSNGASHPNRRLRGLDQTSCRCGGIISRLRDVSAP